MTFYGGRGGCICGYNGMAGCTCRHSIDNVTGRPIVIADFTIPVYKGSTLITEFQFPFTLQNSDTVEVVMGSPEILEDATIVKTGSDLVTIRWDTDVTSELEEATSGAPNSFRIRVTNSVSGIVKVYNEIKILLV